MRKRYSAIWKIAAFMVLLVAYFWYLKHEYRKLTPKAGGIHAFLAEMPKPARIESFDLEGQHYIELIGHSPTGLLIVPSGPPRYVFDAKGNLVDWTQDDGDDPEFR